jgi:hypothetical protein
MEDCADAERQTSHLCTPHSAFHIPHSAFRTPHRGAARRAAAGAVARLNPLQRKGAEKTRSARACRATFVVHASAWRIWYLRLAMWHVPPQPEGWTTNQMPSRRSPGARCSTRDASNGDQDGGDPQPTLTQRRREDAERAGVPGNVRSARFSVGDLVFAPGHGARPPHSLKAGLQTSCRLAGRLGRGVRRGTRRTTTGTVTRLNHFRAMTQMGSWSFCSR